MNKDKGVCLKIIMGYFTEHDKNIIKKLASEYKKAAESRDNEKSIKRAYRVNDLGGGRPYVSIDEIPWVEMNVDNCLTEQCEHPFARNMETFFRRELLRFNYFRTDRILLPVYYVGKSYDNSGFGLTIQDDIIVSEKGNNIVSHSYHDVLPDEEAINKMHPIVITPHPEKDAVNLEMANELLGGILPVKLRGMCYFYFAPWDQLVRYHGVENTFFDIYDRPEFLHALIEKYIDIHMDYLDQMDRYGLLDGIHHSTDLHCTAPYSKALPEKEVGEHVSTNDMWLRCTAQAFGSCSPEVYDEFEIQPVARVRARFKQTYYGCCEPLENVLPYLLKYPDIRKLGVSPFANVEKCAEQIGNSHILSRKPNPSLLAGGFSEENIFKELANTVKICDKYGCSYDYVLKDISTVDHKPERLSIWAKTVRDYLDRFYGDY